MYRREALVLYRNIGSEGWPCSNYQEQNIIPLERALLYKYVKTSLYKKQLNMGMLSLYAKPFYPVTNNLSSEKDTTEIRNDQQNRKESRKQEENTGHRDTVENYIKNNKLINITNTTNKSEHIKDKWIKVQNHAQEEK